MSVVPGEGYTGPQDWYLDEGLIIGHKDIGRARTQLGILNSMLKSLRAAANRVNASPGTLATIGGMRHDQLLELTDDDHVGYLLANGSRNLTGNLAVNPSVTIDGVDVSTHESRHISGGADPFLATDFLEAIVKRLRESSGPTTLVVGAVADGEYLKRVGATVVGAAVGAGASATPYRETFVGDNVTVAFVLARAVSAALEPAIQVFLSGQGLEEGGIDYTFSGGNTVSVVAAKRPKTGQRLVVRYWA